MEMKCPTCGLERTVDAASAEHAGEQTCDPCAASYKALLAEIEVRSARRTAGAATDAHAEAPAPLLLTASANDGDSEAKSLSPEKSSSPAAGAGDEQEEYDSDGYALGVSLYRLPATGLAVGAACLLAALFFAGWLRPADAAQSASVIEPTAVAQSAVAESAGVQDADDKVGGESTSAPADAELPTAADEPVAAAGVAAGEASAEEIDEAQFEKEELAAEAGGGPESAPAPAPEPAKSAAEGGRFTVQVGSHNQPGEAQSRASVLRAAGFDARVAAVEIPGKGTWHRVQSGRFQTREQAALYEKSLRASGAAETTFVAESAN